MVHVAVGEQDGRGTQVVLLEHLAEGLDHADSRVDDEAFLPGGGGQDETVGVEGSGGEPDGEHPWSLVWVGIVTSS